MANARFIERTARALSRGRKTIMKKFDALSVQHAAEKGDAAAHQTYNEMAENLGIGLAKICGRINPDLIVLAGGISNAKMIYAPAMKKMKQLSAKQNAGNVKILHTKIGYLAGAIGAALLASKI